MLKNMCDLNKPSKLGFSFKDHSQKKYLTVKQYRNMGTGETSVGRVHRVFCFSLFTKLHIEKSHKGVELSRPWIL